MSVWMNKCRKNEYCTLSHVEHNYDPYQSRYTISKMSRNIVQHSLTKDHLACKLLKVACGKASSIITVAVMFLTKGNPFLVSMARILWNKNRPKFAVVILKYFKKVIKWWRTVNNYVVLRFVFNDSFVNWFSFCDWDILILFINPIVSYLTLSL